MVMAPSEKIRKKEGGTKERQTLYSLCTFTLHCEQSTLYMKYRGMFLLHLDRSVLVENGPLVKFTRNCIRDSSGIFFFISSLGLRLPVSVQCHHFCRVLKDDRQTATL